MRIVTLLTVVSLALVLSLARADDTLVKFDRGIGVDPVSNAQGMAATANVVTRNIVRGVQPAALWVIAELKAEVKDDGRITVDGRGLVFASGDAFGTALVLTPTGAAASITVFAMKTLPHSSNAIRTRFLSPRTGTSRSTTCCRRHLLRPPALHPCC